MAELLRVDRDDRDVVTLTLNRPEARNAFTAELMRELTTAVRDLENDKRLRALVVTGTGSAFSAGADLNWMSAMADYSFEENVADSRNFEAMLRAVHDFPAPTLARVNGHALGGAAGLLSCIDIVVAVRGAWFGFTETRVGLVPAMISAYAQKRIGEGQARRYFLTGERFDTDRAFQLGLVHEVCEPDHLDDVFERVLGELLASGPVAQRETKQLIAAIAAADSLDATEQRRLETIARIRVGDEAQQRMRAFFDR